MMNHPSLVSQAFWLIICESSLMVLIISGFHVANILLNDSAYTFRFVSRSFASNETTWEDARYDSLFSDAIFIRPSLESPKNSLLIESISREIFRLKKLSSKLFRIFALFFGCL